MQNILALLLFLQLLAPASAQDTELLPETNIPDDQSTSQESMPQSDDELIPSESIQEPDSEAPISNQSELSPPPETEPADNQTEVQSKSEDIPTEKNKQVANRFNKNSIDNKIPIEDMNLLENAISTPDLASDGLIQEMDLPFSHNEYQPLSLRQSIEQGLRNSHDKKISDLTSNKLDLNWAKKHDSFWYPSLGLRLSSDTQLISKLKTGGYQENASLKNPSRSIGLETGDYTVFNWGKDYADYISYEKTFLRNKEIIKEGTLQLKQSLIKLYLKLVMIKNQEQLSKKQLRYNSFIYRLAQEKIKSQKISKQEFFQTRAEYLRSQQEYYQAVNQSELIDEAMSHALGDPKGTRYRHIENINFEVIRLPLKDAISIAEKNNANVKNANLLQDNADRNYDKAMKENLPLPKFSVNFGAYKYHFGNGQSNFQYRTYPGNSTIELVATLNASWTLWGDEGLLNSRKMAQALIDKYQTSIEKEKGEQDAIREVRDAYRKIFSLQKQYKIATVQASNLQKLFDLNLDAYTNRSVRHSDLKASLIEFISAEKNLEEIKYQQAICKVDLARVLNVENFPGENFENLATRSEAKK